MKKDFFVIITAEPRPRGYPLEKFLRELFDLFEMDPKASFKLVGEQIDGASPSTRTTSSSKPSGRRSP